MNPKSNDRTGLLDDLPRGVTHRSLDEHYLPLAAWANPDEILQSEKLRHGPEKFLLGAINGQFIGTDDNRHVLLAAGSRSGKAVSSIIPNHLIGMQGSSFTIDPKGEISSIVAEHLAAQGKKVIILDPYCRTGPWVRKFRASFNPLSMLKNSLDMVEGAGLIADGIVSERSTNDPHWDSSSIAVLEALILHTVTFPAYEGKRDLITVRRLLTQGVPSPENKSLGGLEGLLREMVSNEALDGLIQGAAMSLASKSEKELDSIISTAERHTKFLDYPAMRTVLERSDFEMSEIKTSPNGVALFEVLPAGLMGLCKGWLRLTINQILNAMESTRLREGGPLDQTGTGKPVTFYLDEFGTLGKMQQIQTAAAQVAGFGVKLFFIVQDLGQLQENYGNAWQTFLGNCGVQIFFGTNDPFTQEFISKRLGQTTLIVKNHSQQTHGSQMAGATGDSFNIQIQDLLTPEEVGRYFARDDRHRRQLVLLAGKDPMILQRVVYHDQSLPEHHHFAGKYRGWS